MVDEKLSMSALSTLDATRPIDRAARPGRAGARRASWCEEPAGVLCPRFRCTTSFRARGDRAACHLERVGNDSRSHLEI